MMVRDIIIRVYKKIFGIKKKDGFKKGKRFYSNSLIDTLVPEFVEIGDDFISAPGSIILAHDASLYLFTEKYRIEKTVIGNSVFLGANSIIMPGVKIGNNVIVGAGSVVTKDVCDDSVVAGNPAKFMCTVKEYCDKCFKKGILYEVPKQWKERYNKDMLFDQELISKFRVKVKKQYKVK